MKGAEVALSVPAAEKGDRLVYRCPPAGGLPRQRLLVRRPPRRPRRGEGRGEGRARDQCLPPLLPPEAEERAACPKKRHGLNTPRRRRRSRGTPSCPAALSGSSRRKKRERSTSIRRSPSPSPSTPRPLAKRERSARWRGRRRTPSPRCASSAGGRPTLHRHGRSLRRRVRLRLRQVLRRQDRSATEVFLRFVAKNSSKNSQKKTTQSKGREEEEG